ncbi:DMT family transporter [Paenibacillus nasutitermitis]|uniref:Membrane protein n=1 Tax=Paenibacillus nasutitermitis TaxID=1652958 RepID=A0A916YQ02_9BACL|nr:DMT family transporter [Paenibacillus nasutitermitis]GGD55645.1 membrane protein [Paenibacillus nasutitermitis]
MISVIMVLASGTAHAIWNMLAKKSENKQFFLWIIYIPATLLLLPSFLEEIIKPATPQGYLLLLLSLIIQGCYAFFLSQSLTYGDMSQVYPMMRGIATLLVPLIGVLFLNESLSPWGWMGLICIVLGFCITSGMNFSRSKNVIPLRVILLTIAVGMCTMSYVLVDKINLQHFSPVVLLEVSNIGFMLGLMPFIRFKQVRWKKEWKENGVVLMMGSILSPGSYLLFLFAMSLTPLTYVAPLREIGTVIGTLAGIYLLKETKELSRLVSAGMIFAGILLIGIWGL